MERFETARRLALAAAPGSPGERAERAIVLHDALCRLGDLPAAMEALGEAGEGFEASVRRYEDLYRAAAMAFYRDSSDQREGITWSEYAQRLGARRATVSEGLLAEVAPPQAPRLRALVALIVADAERCTEADVRLLAELDRRFPQPSTPAPESPVSVRVQGRIRFADGGTPRGTVTLGIEGPIDRPSPEQVDPRVISLPDRSCGELAALAAVIDGDGGFRIAGHANPGTGFLALTLDDGDGLRTRFVARGLRIDGSPLADVDLVVAPWSAAVRQAGPPALPAVIEHDGARWHLQADEVISNPFWHDFPRQDLRLAWSAPPAGSVGLVWDGGEVPHQVDGMGRVLCFAALARRSARRIGWYHRAGTVPTTGAAAPSSLLRIADDGRSAVIDTGVSAFRLPWGSAADAAAPILAARGPDGTWRGAGRWELGGRSVPMRTAALLGDGPLECIIEIAYRFADGARCSFTLTAHRGEEYLLVEERGEAIDGVAFILGLEDFRGGRGYLHWCAEGEAPHWRTLVDEDRELARLQESVPWWIPPAGFAWAATFDGLDRHDLLGVFSRRRGDWVDHAFAAIAGGPPAGGHELDWPYPEMVGSTISMITVRSTSDGRLEMRFPRFSGERHWGLLASDMRRGDGPLKELQQVRHKTSFPRLDELRSWHLEDVDCTPRPSLVVDADRIAAVRRRTQDPDVARLWERIRDGGGRHLDSEALRFVLTGDPLAGWRLGRQLAALVPAQARCLLLSRENGDVWSPVGGRVWAPQACAYDAVVASGALDGGEQREVRAGLLLAGRMFMSPDLMNWRYGARNANFESDRVDAVGTIGLCFAGNPDAQEMVAHVVERMGTALAAYCTPGSGKWYENPACYYLQAFRCRMSIACHLAERGGFDLAGVPRIADFAGWLLRMLTPRLPSSFAVMRDGCTHAEYAGLDRVRRIAPIGDHAHLGAWVPDVAVAVASHLRESLPGLAVALRWAWHEGGRDGGYFGSAPLVLAQTDAADATGLADPGDFLASRRLEGFGAVFRGDVGGAKEFMLLGKLGPGGYRYHRSEGSFILVADGRPLVYDGGEAGEAWRHSGITYHDVRLPPSPGRIERFASLPSVDYAQGAHPVVLQPGDPIFLSDVCDHRLVDEALRRARIERPAAARAWLWVKDEYVVVWDRVDVDAGTVHRWNLQVMADGEAGDPGAADGLRFRGRFGTDLQVLLPAGGDRPWSVEEVALHEYRLPRAESVTQRHLEVTGGGAADWLAVLRPLAPGARPVTATPLTAFGRTVGVHVQGDGIDDRIVLGRTPVAVEDGVWSFSGIAGAYLRRPAGARALLLGAGRVAAAGLELAGDGPAAELFRDDTGPRLRVDGPGTVRATAEGREIAR